MKFAVLKCINGNFTVHAEGFTDLGKAKVSFHGLCQTLWNADDVITASVITSLMRISMRSQGITKSLIRTFQRNKHEGGQ